MNYQTEVARVTKFTKLKMVVPKHLRVRHNCEMVCQKSCSFFTVVHPFTTFLFHGNLRMLSKLCFFTFSCLSSMRFMLQSHTWLYPHPLTISISISLQHLIVRYPHFQKDLFIADDRQLYLHLKRSGFWHTPCLEIVKWLNRVNGGHEFRKHETVLF